MQLIQDILPFLMQPKNIIILIIVFLVAYWIVSTLKFISSIVLKILVALLIVSIAAYFLGIDNFLSFI